MVSALSLDLIDSLEVRCARVSRTLDSDGSDDIMLLRAARDLKRVHGELARMAQSRVRACGRGAVVERALDLLLAVEEDLRCILLEYFTLPRRQIREHLQHALDGAFATLDLLAP